MWVLAVLLLVFVSMRAFVCSDEVYVPLANLRLRRGVVPACLRSESTEPLEMEWAAIESTVSKFVESLNNGTLNLKLFDSRLNSENPAKMSALLNVATHLVDTCGIAAPLSSAQLCDIYWGDYDNFLALVAARYSQFTFTQTDVQDKNKRTGTKRHVCESLNVMTFPATSLTNSSLLFCANPMCMPDIEVLEDIATYHCMR
jgi:hypothetical protein